ncbi:TPA: hypothetical protein NY308_001950 [Proteus mirabilis]|nr:hypothetical protein [Proteus mirabilis]HBC5640152.1 hypothetical protein [Proteus mirabilis]HBC5643388.1 hypothetical protein [Proteus mirabilis]HCK1902198.1 hypothetical protein [Proteus mirabilis]HEI8679121.1 hypothetical protein [Proteus mirabilis]
MITQEASSKFLGFLYQIERVLYRIFSSEHSLAVFAVETADDVVEEITYSNGKLHIIFEQDKHSIALNSQPYQDSNKNLWHTLHIWLSTIDEYKNKYEKITYCLVTNKSVGEKTLAKKISIAESDEDINKAIKELKNQAKMISGKTKEIAEKVINYSEDKLKYLIKCIVLLDNDGTISGEPLKQATINLFHLTSEYNKHSNYLYQTLIGFIIDKCQTSWRKKEPVLLTKDPIFNLLQNEINKIKRKSFTEQSLFKTSFQEYLKNDNNSGNHLFIEQLQSIGHNTEACNLALINYWAFYSEKIRLQEAGETPISAWEDRDDQLYNRWININLSTIVNSNEKDLPHYQNIYSKTVTPDYNCPINGYNTTNSYFTIGNYHALANDFEGDYFIYWHDNYKKDN